MTIHPHAAECPRRQDAPGGRAEQARHPLGDAVPARATHASHRARILGLGLSVGIAIALAGCDERPRTDEFTLVAEVGEDIWLVRDNRTTCEYIWTTGGGLELRSDGYGNVTPNCAGSHGYAKDFPYGERPDQSAPKGGAQ